MSWLKTRSVSFFSDFSVPIGSHRVSFLYTQGISMGKRYYHWLFGAIGETLVIVSRKELGRSVWSRWMVRTAVTVLP